MGEYAFNSESAPVVIDLSSILGDFLVKSFWKATSMPTRCWVSSPNSFDGMRTYTPEKDPVPSGSPVPDAPMCPF
jgi:hypothetical protein